MLGSFWTGGIWADWLSSSKFIWQALWKEHYEFMEQNKPAGCLICSVIMQNSDFLATNRKTCWYLDRKCVTLGQRFPVFSSPRSLWILRRSSGYPLHLNITFIEAIKNTHKIIYTQFNNNSQAHHPDTPILDENVDFSLKKWSNNSAISSFSHSFLSHVPHDSQCTTVWKSCVS